MAWWLLCVCLLLASCSISTACTPQCSDSTSRRRSGQTCSEYKAQYYSCWDQEAKDTCKATCGFCDSGSLWNSCAWLRSNSNRGSGERQVGYASTPNECISMVQQHCPSATIANLNRNAIDNHQRSPCWCQYGGMPSSQLSEWWSCYLPGMPSPSPSPPPQPKPTLPAHYYVYMESHMCNGDHERDWKVAKRQAATAQDCANAVALDDQCSGTTFVWSKQWHQCVCTLQDTMCNAKVSTGNDHYDVYMLGDEASSCVSGQIQHPPVTMFETAGHFRAACEAKCRATPGCVAFDYTTSKRRDSCRGIKSGQTPQLNKPGPQNRRYCVVAGKLPPSPHPPSPSPRSNWPVFQTAAALKASPWGRYYEKIYHSIPGSNFYPLDVGQNWVLFNNVLIDTKLEDSLSAAVTCPSKEYERYMENCFYQPPSVSFIWHAYPYSGVPASTWAEVIHQQDPFGDEVHGMWFQYAPGSGIWFNTGKTIVFKDHQEAYNKWNIHGVQDPNSAFCYAAAVMDDYDSVQFNEHVDHVSYQCDTSHTKRQGFDYMGLEIVAVKLVGTYSCGTRVGAPPVIRRGWHAASPCNCDNHHPYVNCHGTPRFQHAKFQSVPNTTYVLV